MTQVVGILGGMGPAAGADFVLVGDFIWQDTRGAPTALIEAGQAVARGFETSLARASVTGE